MDKLDSGNDVLLEIDVQGAMKVKEAYKDALLVFLKPPDINELFIRLRGRNTEIEDVIQKRIEVATFELKSSSEYNYAVVNDEVERAAKEISDIIDMEKIKRS